MPPAGQPVFVARADGHSDHTTVLPWPGQPPCLSQPRPPVQDGQEVSSKMINISSVAFWTQSHNCTWFTCELHRGVSYTAGMQTFSEFSKLQNTAFLHLRKSINWRQIATGLEPAQFIIYCRIRPSKHNSHRRSSVALGLAILRNFRKFEKNWENLNTRFCRVR